MSLSRSQGSCLSPKKCRHPPLNATRASWNGWNHLVQVHSIQSVENKSANNLQSLNYIINCTDWKLNRLEEPSSLIRTLPFLYEIIQKLPFAPLMSPFYWCQEGNSCKFTIIYCFYHGSLCACAGGAFGTLVEDKFLRKCTNYANYFTSPSSEQP